jgi:hypothetical protein
MEEMQGIMTLPQGGAAPQPTAGPQEEELFQAMRQDIPPRQFSDELLGAGSQVDPQVVQEFIDTLSNIEMPMEGLELLNGMVDEILATPQDYPRIRRKYLSQGVPEDILPPQFDPMFFAALNMAVDYLVVQEPSPMGMAGGGIADLAQYGRYGDTMLAHITPEEAALLKARGGSGTINPVTGLPEFWNPLKDIKNALKSAGNAIARGFRSVGRAVKKFAQSTVGRIVLPIALGFFLGPTAMRLFSVQAGTLAGTALSAFTGSAAAAALRGENLRDVLKSGATGAVLAGVAGEVFGHPGATQAPAPISEAGQTATSAAATGVPEALPSVAVDTAADAASGGIQTLVTNTAAEPALSPLSIDTVMGTSGTDALSKTTVAPVRSPNISSVDTSDALQQVNRSYADAQGAFQPSQVLNQPPPATVNLGAQPLQARSSLLPDSMVKFEEGASSLFDKAKETYDKYMPEALGGSRGQVTEQGIRDQIPKARQLIEAARPDLANAVPGTREAEIFNTLVGRKAIELATPGMLSTYAPVAALGAGLMYAGGAFEKPPVTVPQMPDMMDPKYARPLQFGGLYGSRGYSNIPRMPVAAAEGGIMALEMGGTTYPRKQGHIKGPGTGTSDSIPALLSDGEFVFTAKSVRNLGNGSRRKGAKRLYAMMKMLEERKV